MRNSLFLVMFLIAPVTGCLDTGDTPVLLSHRLGLEEMQETLSAPVYDTVERLETTVESADGTRIWLDIFRPAGASEKLPVIFQMTPYRILTDAASTDCTSVEREACPLDPELVAFFVPRGYAVAFADVRGTHDSGGCNDFTGPTTARDGYEIVEWLAAQPWSNGRVGMYGGSFDGAVQVATATLDPPHLATIVPVATPTSQYRFFFHQGVPYVNRPVGTPGAYFAIGAAPGTDPNAVTTYPERLDCQPSNFEAGVDMSGDWNAYWEARDYDKDAGKIRASVLQVHGFNDSNVFPTRFDTFWNNITTAKRLILGQWGHADCDRPDWPLIRHRWFDHYLKGIDTGILQDLPPILIEDDTGVWRGLDALPNGSEPGKTFFLTADGALAPGAEDATLQLRDYPRLPTEDDIYRVITPVADAAGTPARITFVSEPLAEDLHYTGRPWMHLVASTDARSTHWAVRVFDLGPDDDPMSTGDESPLELYVINRGFLDTRHRFGVDDPQDLTPGERYDATLWMYTQDDVIEKGHRLYVVLNNNDNQIHQDTTYATSTVFFGPEGTRLVLPLAPAGRPIPEDALRDDLRPASDTP